MENAQGRMEHSISSRHGKDNSGIWVHKEIDTPLGVASAHSHSIIYM